MEIPFYDCLSPVQLHHDSQAELFARAAARAHFWLAEAPPATTHQAPVAIAPRQPPRSHFVTRSQILRTFEPLNPEELDEHLPGTQKMISYSEPAKEAVPSLLHPESARGTTRPLRPPDAEGMSIRAPPHRPAVTAKRPVKEQHQHSNSIAFTLAVAAARTTSKGRNKFPITAGKWLSSTRLRVFSQACVSRAEGRTIRPAKDKFMAFRPCVWPPR